MNIKRILSVATIVVVMFSVFAAGKSRNGRSEHNAADYEPPFLPDVKSRAENTLRYAATPNRFFALGNFEKACRRKAAIYCGPRDISSMVGAWRALLRKAANR